MEERILNNKKAFFSIDLESFYDIGFIKKRYQPSSLNITGEEEYISKFLDLFDQYGVKATIFVTMSSYVKVKDILQNAIIKGHEIALHGKEHISPVKLSDKEFEEQIKDGKTLLEEDLKIHVKGYRAPCFGLSDSKQKILKELGFTYDSSSNPFKIAIESGSLSLTGFSKIDDIVYKDDAMEYYEFPICAVNIPFIQFPVSGGAYVRMFSWGSIKKGISKYIKNHNIYVFYAHPYEIYPKKHKWIKGLNWFEMTFINKGKVGYLDKIEKIIKELIKEDYQFLTFSEYIKSIN